MKFKDTPWYVLHMYRSTLNPILKSIKLVPVTHKPKTKCLIPTRPINHLRFKQMSGIPTVKFQLNQA